MASGRVSKVKGKVVDIPNVPTIGTATAGPESATIPFTPNTIGGPTFTYTVTSNPGSVTATGFSPVTVSGLNAGTAYTFTGVAVNPTGQSGPTSASNSVTPILLSDYERIATATAGSGGSATLSFSSIPSGFKHLQIRYTAQSNRGTFSVDNIFGTINNDSGSNYSYHFMRGDGLNSTSTQTTGEASVTTFRAGSITSSVTASMFGVGVIDILNYNSTSKFKTTRGILGFTENTAGTSSLFNNVYTWSTTWRSTSAITSIQLYPQSGTAFTEHSTFALYGIK